MTAWQNKCPPPTLYCKVGGGRFFQAGEEGFEPSVPGSKGRCLTTWPLPSASAILPYMADSSTDKARQRPSGTIIRDDIAPGWVWRASVWITALTGVAVGVVLLLALDGIADVAPNGAPVIEQDMDDLAGWTPATSRDAIDWDWGTGQLTVIEAETRAVLLSPNILSTSGTLLIRLIQTRGPQEAGYGLWWGDAARSEEHTS